MSDTSTTYTTKVSGLWSPRHEIHGPDGRLGVLSASRNRWGTVAEARYAPEKGEVLLMRRDPGLLRSQFSLWTEGREWLGSSLRWSFVGRAITIHTASKPLRLLPAPGLRRGWRLVAPRTGEVARITAGGLGRGTRIEVHQRVDFEIVLFAYFLGSLILWESAWPGPDPARTSEATAVPTKA